MIPEALLVDYTKGKISGEALALYALIRLRWGGYDSCFPKQESIAALAGFSVDKVQRLLKVLNSTGWILSERQNRIHGNNEYFICDEPFVKPEATQFSEVL